MALKLLDKVRQTARLQHLSLRTEQAYVHWVRRFVLYHDKRHPREMGAPELRDFLSHLAVERQVAASTQNQALAALLFLYRSVLEQPLPAVAGIAPARRPAVLTREEAARVLGGLHGTPLWWPVSSTAPVSGCSRGCGYG